MEGIRRPGDQGARNHEWTQMHTKNLLGYKKARKKTPNNTKKMLKNRKKAAKKRQKEREYATFSPIKEARTPRSTKFWLIFVQNKPNFTKGKGPLCAWVNERMGEWEAA